MSRAEVHLAIYDLSRGMARTLSTQFLGPNHAMDIIPHTGIIAFGKEYLFGSMGIDFMDPAEFRRSHQIFPIEVQLLGHTQKSQEDFEAWCSRVTISGLYNGGNYNLFHRNCNNFSHDAAMQGLGLSQGVPNWILETPTRFLSSPLGQMVTPMLQQMQISGPQTGSRFQQERWGHVSSSTSASPTRSQNTTHSEINPWRNHDTPDNSSLEKKKNTTTHPPSTPILDSHKCTLMSTDKNSVMSCINKLLESKASEVETVSILSQLKNDLIITEDKSDTTIENAIHLLISLVQQPSGKKSDILHSLITLRLVVVYIQPNSTTLSNHVLSSLAMICNVPDSLVMTHPSTLCMLWCVLSNVMGSSIVYNHHNTVDSELLTTLMDQAIVTLNSENHGIQVRQVVSAFLYNTAHYLTADPTVPKEVLGDSDSFLNDGIVSMLCGTMDGFVQEQDSLTKFRRLMIVGKLLRPRKEETNSMKKHFELVKNLLLDLGFLDLLTLVSKPNSAERTDLEKNMTEFSRELVMLLQTS